MARKINTVKGVIEALGGPRAVALLIGVGESAVWNWPSRGFPPETYVLMQGALAALEPPREAPSSLWQMREAAE